MGKRIVVLDDTTGIETAQPAGQLLDVNGNIIFSTSPVVSAANYLVWGNNIAGSAPAISTAGASTDINVNVTPKGAGLLTVNGVQVLLTSGSVTVTGKRIVPRTVVTASTATLSPGPGSGDCYTVTALAVNMAINASGGFSNGEKMAFRFKDNGTSRTLTWNAFFRALSGITLPTATTISKWHYVWVEYNGDDSLWDVRDVKVQA